MPNRLAKGHSHEVDDSGCEAHLENTSQHHRPPDADQVAKGKLDSNGEKEEDDPNLRQELNLVDPANEPEPVGACQGSGEKETKDHGKSHPVEEQHNHQGEAQKDDEVGEKGNCHRQKTLNQDLTGWSHHASAALRE